MPFGRGLWRVYESSGMLSAMKSAALRDAEGYDVLVTGVPAHLRNVKA